MSQLTNDAIIDLIAEVVESRFPDLSPMKQIKISQFLWKTVQFMDIPVSHKTINTLIDQNVTVEEVV